MDGKEITVEYALENISIDSREVFLSLVLASNGAKISDIAITRKSMSIVGAGDAAVAQHYILTETTPAWVVRQMEAYPKNAHIWHTGETIEVDKVSFLVWPRTTLTALSHTTPDTVGIRIFQGIDNQTFLNLYIVHRGLFTDNAPVTDHWYIVHERTD